ncbi:MAG: ornithine carbamoyltransferase, partial [Candidatus Electryoneaceae bacterium]|nr:ornithine carbamoyltransferase [Candidatus Electryoneaceae bacterium]
MAEKPRDLLALTDLGRDDMIGLIDHAIRLKDQTRAGACPRPMFGKMAGLIFHKPSLRTRISFEVGVHHLGGDAMFITDKEIQLGARESIADVGRVLSRYLRIIVIRTYHQSDIEELAHWMDAPVINALTDLLHPCQIFCDLMTIKEKLERIEHLKIAYLGDGNNIARSWINAANMLGIDLWIATSTDTHPGEEFVKKASNGAKGRITITDDPSAAVKNADVLYTDVWASMGEKKEVENRMKLLEQFRIDAALLSQAKPSAIVMHCLPAERGREITD